MKGQYLVLECPHCHAELATQSEALRCSNCALKYPVSEDIADFSRGHYYDNFHPSALTPSLELGLSNETAGTTSRILNFYLPLLEKAGLKPGDAILDAGCGSGLSIDLLTDLGYEAWGVDLSALRRWQWSTRINRKRLVVGDVRRTPFPRGYFRAVISSGIIEHIGVLETRSPSGRYAVTPTPNQFEERCDYLAELVRILAPGGVLFVDAPNGLFPIDFWHGDSPGQARRHTWRERFLPTPGRLVAIAREVDPALRVRFVSPFRRIQFGQVRRWWYGKALAPLAALYLSAIRLPGLRWTTRSALNPFLVARMENPRHERPG